MGLVTYRAAAWDRRARWELRLASLSAAGTMPKAASKWLAMAVKRCGSS
jgi:hypothetical protein